LLENYWYSCMQSGKMTWNSSQISPQTDCFLTQYLLECNKVQIK
jgi:hypothetical protein